MQVVARSSSQRVPHPEVLMAARAMKQSMEKRPRRSGIRIARVIGTVHGDLHDIGKNGGHDARGRRMEVIDLGTDVSPAKFVEAASTRQSHRLSALLTTTMPAMKETIAALQEAGLRDRVSVMVGGAPLTQAYADEIGADGYAPDAASAVDTAKQLLRITA